MNLYFLVRVTWNFTFLVMNIMSMMFRPFVFNVFVFFVSLFLMNSNWLDVGSSPLHEIFPLVRLSFQLKIGFLRFFQLLVLDIQQFFEEGVVFALFIFILMLHFILNGLNDFHRHSFTHLLQNAILSYITIIQSKNKHYQNLTRRFTSLEQRLNPSRRYHFGVQSLFRLSFNAGLTQPFSLPLRLDFHPLTSW